MSKQKWKGRGPIKPPKPKHPCLKAATVGELIEQLQKFPADALPMGMDNGDMFLWHNNNIIAEFELPP